MRRIVRAFPVLLVLLAGACSESAVIGPGPDFPFPIDTTRPGGPSTTRQRMVALDVVQAMVSALPGQNFAAETQMLVDYLRAIPQFARAGASVDGTVWAEFTGGMMMYIVHSGPPEAPSGQDVVVPASPSVPAPGWSSSSVATLAAHAPLHSALPAVVHASSVQAANGTVPKSEKFRLMDGIGSYFAETDPRGTIAGMLLANGYTGRPETATVNALRDVRGDGIFYLRSHGGLGSVKSDSATQDLYAFWTATEATDSVAELADPLLLQDLQQKRVVYMLFRSSRWTRAIPAFSPNRHYGITANFISHYMSFAENSLIYIDACEGAVHANVRSAFRGASVFIGWNERAAFSAMGKTAQFMFDRMLGANMYAPESPKQRPFDYDAMRRDPKFGANKQYGYSTWPAGDGGTIRAELVFHHTGGEFGILAPSLALVVPVERQDELHLLGYFGQDPRPDAKVTINNQDVPIISWSPEEIITHLPRTGGNSEGPVIVTVRNHRSNARQLLNWQGTFDYTYRDLGNLNQHFAMDLRGASICTIYATVLASRPSRCPWAPSTWFPIRRRASQLAAPIRRRSRNVRLLRAGPVPAPSRPQRSRIRWPRVNICMLADSTVCPELSR